MCDFLNSTNLRKRRRNAFLPRTGRARQWFRIRKDPEGLKLCWWIELQQIFKRIQTIRMLACVSSHLIFCSQPSDSHWTKDLLLLRRLRLTYTTAISRFEIPKSPKIFEAISMRIQIKLCWEACMQKIRNKTHLSQTHKQVRECVYMCFRFL